MWPCGDGNLVVIVQPPRGFGANLVAIYHDPDLPLSHHYLAAYHWLRLEFGAHAVVHVGKHGSLEWLPGKNAGLSAACAADAAIRRHPADLPVPGQRSGRGQPGQAGAMHATIIDHLVPPMARAEVVRRTYRPAGAAARRACPDRVDGSGEAARRSCAQIWTLIQAAKLDHDLGLDDRPHDAEFDEFLLHVDGWLCEIKDAQIRDGLHILGVAPSGQAGGHPGARDPARPADVGAVRLRHCPDSAKSWAMTNHPVETRTRSKPRHVHSSKRWSPPTGTPIAIDAIVAAHAEITNPVVADVLRFATGEVVPRLQTARRTRSPEPCTR